MGISGGPATNFLQFNPNGNNQENDINYSADSFRENGAAEDEICPSNSFNKLMYPMTAFVAAFAEMMVAKGYTVNDGSAGVSGNNFAALQAALANIMTAADTIPNATSAVSASQLGGKSWHNLVSFSGLVNGATSENLLPGGQQNLYRVSVYGTAYPAVEGTTQLSGAITYNVQHNVVGIPDEIIFRSPTAGSDTIYVEVDAWY
jgi:hypothetical protein